MLTPALTKRRKWSRKIPLRQLVAHRELLKQIISGWNNSREGNSSFLLYHNLIFFLGFSLSLSQWGFSHTFIPTDSVKWFFVTSKQQFSPTALFHPLVCCQSYHFMLYPCLNFWSSTNVLFPSCCNTKNFNETNWNRFPLFHWGIWPKNWLMSREVFQLWK